MEHLATAAFLGFTFFVIPYIAISLFVHYHFGCKRNELRWCWSNGFDIEQHADKEFQVFFSTPLRRALTTFLWPLSVPLAVLHFLHFHFKRTP